MTDTERDDLRTIRDCQLRMEIDLKSLRMSHDEHCHWTESVLSGDESDGRPGLIKRVDRLEHTQANVSGWLKGAWAMLVAVIGSLMAWLLNQGTNR